MAVVQHTFCSRISVLAFIPPSPSSPRSSSHAATTSFTLSAAGAEAKIAALGPPPTSPAPAPKASFAAQVDELYMECGVAKPEGGKLVELISRLEEELLGQAGEGKIKPRVAVLREIMDM
ncbi:hypothetical protein TeGR_g1587 [Tetraparma gracilis]|uniref:Uncharacterized protein n=1 Tax=Tetraparma gracilis TaxID=2962635 RepID=A0ABQ6M881_9STRA|nr:hypothetical protein TeGR_g1587 [Tetraparma gracilis]